MFGNIYLKLHRRIFKTITNEYALPVVRKTMQLFSQAVRRTYGRTSWLHCENSWLKTESSQMLVLMGIGVALASHSITSMRSSLNFFFAEILIQHKNDGKGWLWCRSWVRSGAYYW